MWKRAKRTWKRVGHAIGNFQARILLTVFYGIIVFPFGIFARLFSDPLRVKHSPTQWLDRAEENQDLRWAKRQ
jgi:hypothetical protein